MNYEQKKKELEEKFELIQKEVEQLEIAKQNKLQELFRLQGEFRLLKELENNKE